MSHPASETIRIANIVIGIRYAEESLWRPLSEAASRFSVPDAVPDIVVTVDAMARDLPPPGRLLFESGAVWRAYDDADGFRIDCWSDLFGDAPYKSAFFDRDLRAGRILVRPDAFLDTMHPLDYPLDEVLIAHLLGRGRGVELHGCGIIDRDGRGQLFVGQSGAGKTTTARVWLAEAPYDIVSDDRVIVRNIDGEWRMFGTPWHGEAELSSPQSAPLAAIHLLVQAPRTELVSLPPAQAAAALFGCTFPPFYDAEALSFTLECLDRIVRDLPVRALRFLPDRSIIECVRSAA
ncbi:MAG: hypothetical protein JO093_16945 [Acidobacteria bacterium]|nr:hypothetical protein [Acidobacteriota bacterium]MBV9071821.1 hypothetical protein [Acidobacteriota bacterium]MBV9187305.1 hypothetical protein [Acidobacteriota bacterium]